MIVAPGEILFQPHIEADKEISTAHFSDGQLSDTMAAIPPGGRYNSPTISADNGLQRQLDRNVKMRRENGAHTIDHRSSVCLESVCRVVQPMLEEDTNESVGESIQDELRKRIVDHAASADEAASEDAIVTRLKLLPVTHHVPAVIRVISHHDHDGVTGHGIQSPDDRPPKSVRGRVPDRPKSWNICPLLLEDLPGPIDAVVVYRHDLMADGVLCHLAVKLANGRRDAAVFVTSRYDDRERAEGGRLLGHATVESIPTSLKRGRPHFSSRILFSRAPPQLFDQ